MRFCCGLIPDLTVEGNPALRDDTFPGDLPTNLKRGREREVQIDRERERKRETERDRKRERKRERDRGRERGSKDELE